MEGLQLKKFFVPDLHLNNIFKDTSEARYKIKPKSKPNNAIKM